MTDFPVFQSLFCVDQRWPPTSPQTIETMYSLCGTHTHTGYELDLTRQYGLLDMFTGDCEASYIYAFTYTHIHVHVHIRRVDGIVSMDFANRQQVKEYNKNMTKSGANPRILAERWHRCWKWHPDGRKWHFPGCWLSDFMCNSQYFFERRRSCYLLTFLTEFIFIWISKFNMWIIKTLQLVSRDVSQPSSRRLREYVCLWKSGFCTTQLRQKRWLSINDFLASQYSPVYKWWKVGGRICYGVKVMWCPTHNYKLCNQFLFGLMRP